MMAISRPKVARWLVPSFELLWGICTVSEHLDDHAFSLYLCLNSLTAVNLR